MTDELRALLQQYGILTVTMHQLMRERPGASHENLEDYYRSLGNPLPDEPVLVVRISKDGETRFLSENKHDVRFEDDAGQETGKVTVWELPEDEFWFFRAFRPGFFDLEKELPPFTYSMAV